MSASFILASGIPGAYRLRSFEGVPTVVPGLIVIEPPNPLLEKELTDVLLASGPNTKVAEDLDSASDLAALASFQEPGRQKLLALICDRPFAHQSWFTPWLQQLPDRAVLTIFKHGTNPPAILPPSLQHINAQFWSVAITESVPAILSEAGLTLKEHRIFISYRRLETQPLAQQLFDALTHEGFDVFLDRFSIEPGVNFQQRLTQELADKSMILFLESAWIHASRWTEHEIIFAGLHELGLLALQMPDRGDPLATIYPDFRMPLTNTDFQQSDPVQVPNPDFACGSNPPKEFNQWGLLQDSALQRVVARAKSVHDQAVFRQRQTIRDNVSAALRQAGLNPNAVGADGLMRVSAKGEYALWLTARPPDLADFRTTHARFQPPPGTKGIIIGFTSALEPGRKDALAWLAERCDFACIDKDDLFDAAKRMKEGAL
jgi:hypothetical protein